MSRKISVEFPKNLAFGKVHLAKPAGRRITLRNIHHIDLPFEIEIIEPHPYFHVDPCLGTIPAGESIAINVTYKPITFGSSAMALRLSIKQEGVVPKDCVVSARAVSGLLEKDELVHAQQRIQQCLGDMTLRTNSTLNATGSSYRFDVTRLNTAQSSLAAPYSFGGENSALLESRAVTAPMPGSAKTGTSDGFALDGMQLDMTASVGLDNATLSVPQTAGMSRMPARNRSDPAAGLLAVTFNGASNTYEALNRTIAVKEKPRRRFKPGEEIPPVTDIVDNILLGSKVLDETTGNKVLKSRIRPRPRGLGAGNVFDAGAEWMSDQFHRKHLHRLKLNAKKQEEMKAEEEAKAAAAK